jgi:hypothetical protein
MNIRGSGEINKFILESTCLVFLRIVESLSKYADPTVHFEKYSENIDKLCNFGLIECCLEILGIVSN